MIFSLFYVGSKPVAVGLFTTPWDKVVHGVFFSAIAILLWLATAGRWPFLVAFAVIAIGGLDELHQLTLPGRSAEWADFLVDCAAGASAVCLLSLRNRATRTAHK